MARQPGRRAVERPRHEPVGGRLATAPREHLDALRNDARYAGRLLRREAGYTVSSLLTLAAAIGAFTGLFALARGVLLRPLPYPEPDRLLFLTDVPGVMDRDGKLIEQLTTTEARALIADGTISGGMIPKVETCVDAVERGVSAAVILDGRIQHVLLIELFTEHGAGTMIVRG